MSASEVSLGLRGALLEPLREGEGDPEVPMTVDVLVALIVNVEIVLALSVRAEDRQVLSGMLNCPFFFQLVNGFMGEREEPGGGVPMGFRGPRGRPGHGRETPEQVPCAAFEQAQRVGDLIAQAVKLGGCETVPRALHQQGQLEGLVPEALGEQGDVIQAVQQLAL